MTSTYTCIHCTEPIDYRRDAVRWAHTGTGLGPCDPTDELKRALPAPPVSGDRGPRSPWGMA